jgi:catechol 2,3-dioxygenase-like lactoylglutathione lyase family enzyme
LDGNGGFSQGKKDMENQIIAFNTNKTYLINFKKHKHMKHITTFLAAILLTASVYAPDSTTIKFSFNHLALSVKDVNRSAAFYTTVLKLPEIVNRTKIEGIRWFALADGKELHLISIIKKKFVINKAIHMGLSTNNFDAFIQRLVSLKIPYSDWTGKPNTVNIRTDGVKQIFFQDPDGYWVEVNNVEL